VSAVSLGNPSTPPRFAPRDCIHATTYQQVTRRDRAADPHLANLGQAVLADILQAIRPKP
jgi:hypothetical protein